MVRLVPASSSSRHSGRPPASSRRSGRPPAIPAAREPEPAGDPGHDGGRPVRVRHAARHSRTSELRPRPRTSLSIRSAERRRWAADLSGPGSGGLVVYGMGGIGKSTLAAQITARVGRLQASRVISVIGGELPAAVFAAGPAEADFIVLENFDDNLSLESGRWTIRDPDLAALLGTWKGKLLITCRHPFTLGEHAFALGEHASPIRLAFRRLGPLTRSGAAELTTALPAIRLLGEAERDQVWRLTAGHPLAMEYLDRLLARGERYPELADRLETAIRAALKAAPADVPVTGTGLPRTEPTELPEATAELVASAAGEVMFGELFDRLGAGARSLLVRAAAFRGPVSAGLLAARPGHIAECEAAGLLTIASGCELAVHRWTAGELHRRMAGAGLGGQLAAAHRQAAAYWLSRPGQRGELEAAYHQRRAAELGRAPAPPAARPARRLRMAGAGALAALSVVLAVEAGHVLSEPHLASAEGPVPASSAPVNSGAVNSAAVNSAAVNSAAVNSAAVNSAAVNSAAAVRDQAAGWVTRQVSGAAIIACDPAMCAALAQRGVPSGNLLALRPGTGDPLGSDVVLGTAAVRGLFGSRLAAVYAPEVLASFGTGPARIDVRVVAPDGSAAYRRALAADRQARRAAGLQLLRDRRLTASPAARAALAAGQVDARLLITLAVLAASQPVQVTGFGVPAPGASPGLPLRTAELTAPAGAVHRMLAFLRAQRSPYLPAYAGRTGSVLTVEFGAPAPLGLLHDH